MTEKTTHARVRQESRPFYLTTPFFKQANQVGVQGLKARKDKETSLDSREAGTHKVSKVNQKNVPRKFFTDRKGSNKSHSILYRGSLPRNNELPKAALLPERFVNLLMTSGRKDKARKCLYLALLSMTGRIGVPDPLKSLANLPLKQNQIDLKLSANQGMTNENQVCSKQGKVLQSTHPTQRASKTLSKELSPKNQGFAKVLAGTQRARDAKDRRSPVATSSKTNQPSNVLEVCEADLPAGLAKGSNNPLMNACLANLKWVWKRLNPAFGFRSDPQVSHPLGSIYRANSANRIKAIERTEKGFVRGWDTPLAFRNSPIYPTLGSNRGRELVDAKHEFYKGGEILIPNKEGGEKPSLQQHPFLSWRNLLSFHKDSRSVRALPSVKQSCLAKNLRNLELGRAKQFLPTLPFATLSLPFYGKRFETNSPLLLSQNSFSFSFVRRSLRENFVLTKSGIERQQETREGRDHLMGLLWQSFLLRLGRPKDVRTNPLREGCSANLNVVACTNGLPPTTNRSLHFLAVNTPLNLDVEAVRKLFPFAQSTKFKRLPAARVEGFRSKSSALPRTYQTRATANLFNLERTFFLAKPPTVGKKWVRLESNLFSTCFPGERLGLTPGRPNEKVNPALSGLWRLKPNMGFNPQDEKDEGLRDHYIWHTQVLLKGVQRVQPALEVRRVRKGRNTFQVPAVVKHKRGEKLAIKWIVDSARKSRQKGNKGFSESLGNQLLQSFDRLGEARSKRNELLRLAESNRPFLRFRWW